MLGKLFHQRPTPARSRIDGVINSNLAVLVIEPGIYVLSTLLEDLLPQDDRLGSGIREEVVFRYGATRADRGSAVVPQVKDPSLHAEPAQIPCHGDTDMT